MEVGHNTKASEAQTAFVLSKYESSLEDKKSADGKHSSLCDKLQRKGLDTKAANEAIKIHKSGEATDKVAYLEKLAVYLNILGTPLESDQTDLFRPADADQTPEERAAIDGYRKGLLGLGDSENKHDISTRQGQAWQTAWLDGHAERKKLIAQFTADELSETPEQPEPEDDGDQSDIEDETQDAA
ncbi:hypothetical protein [Roseibium album]|uniref:hypothetical protein n=1 Tax=Roseibium album TaxID=311410 RepID=UPI003919140B